MEDRESILDAIYEQDDFENVEDVEMVDAEEGEILQPSSRTEVEQSCDGNVELGDGGSQKRNRRRRANKKKNKRKRSGPAPEVTDINRFVIDTCRRLKEKKSYMVYTAVGCLGVAALSDLIAEVDAIQACGGQTTADGKRHRTGGGILWNIIKARQPAVYKEIMKKAKEFEKQFRQPNLKRATKEDRVNSSERTAYKSSEGVQASASDGAKLPQDQGVECSTREQRKSVRERIRVPVSYDDLLGEEPLDAAA